MENFAVCPDKFSIIVLLILKDMELYNNGKFIRTYCNTTT